MYSGVEKLAADHRTVHLQHCQCCKWTVLALKTVEFEGFVGSHLEGHVTKFAPREALTLIMLGKLTSDQRVVVRRVETVEADLGVRH